MTRRKAIYGILIFFGFAAIATFYFVVMSGTANIHGTVSVGSSIVSGEENPLGAEDAEMIAVNGYCIKGPDSDNRLLLSTKNKSKSGKLNYSFTAKEGMRHLIIVYLQLDHLTGETGQTQELQFMTNIIKNGDLQRDFVITYQVTNGINMINITVAESADKNPKVFEYPVSKIPDVIKI